MDFHIKDADPAMVSFIHDYRLTNKLENQKQALEKIIEEFKALKAEAEKRKTGE